MADITSENVVLSWKMKNHNKYKYKLINKTVLDSQKKGHNEAILTSYIRPKPYFNVTNQNKITKHRVLKNPVIWPLMILRLTRTSALKNIQNGLPEYG